MNNKAIFYGYTTVTTLRWAVNVCLEYSLKLTLKG